MKVAELIALLEEQDPEAEVLIMSQPSWPFEYAVCGLARRSEPEDVDDDETEPAHGNGEASGARDDRATSDVFIVEGTQLRYGSKRAWEVVAR
jgi:hypothetical protein